MKTLAFDIPDHWDMGDMWICVKSVISDGLDIQNIKTGTSIESAFRELDAIEIGKQYSSKDYKIITETEDDHMLFRVERR